MIMKKNRVKTLLFLLLAVTVGTALYAEPDAPPSAPENPPAQGGVAISASAKDIYATQCAGCHGVNFEGGPGGSLMMGPWKHGRSAEEIFAGIKAGYPDKGMAPYGPQLSDSQIRSLTVMILEKQSGYAKSQIKVPRPVDNMTAQSKLHDYKIEPFVDGLKEPWSMAWMPDGRAIVTEKNGGLRIIENGKLLPEPIANVPATDTETEKQGGLFDVKLHPDFAKNQLIYLSFADKQTAPKGFRLNMTRVIRAKLEGNALRDIKDIFVAPPVNYGENGNFGGRMAFGRDGMLYFSIGDRGQRQTAESQKLSTVTGKIHRLRDDGTVPDDNPFVNTPNAVKSIWAYGVRNPQGLCFNPDTGDLWETEHGMRGGDELNVITKAANYGWPMTTYGTDYGGKMPSYSLNGKTAEAVTEMPGVTSPRTYWTPSIAVSGIEFYTGDLFPKWKGNLFVTSLVASELRRIEIADGKVVDQEVIFRGLGRLRFIVTGPDGALYVARPDRISRIVPAN